MSSIYGTILTQVKDSIEGITLTGTPIVRRRKKFLILDVEDNQIIICSGRETDVNPEEYEGTENVLTIRYPVYIGIAIHATGDDQISNEDLMFEYREQIRRTLLTPTAVAPSEPVEQVSIDFNPAIELGGIRDNMNVSTLAIYYDVCEPRFS